MPQPTQAFANLLMAGGMLPASPYRDDLCRAFRDAAQKFCDDWKKGKCKGEFNDYFYEALRNPVTGNPALAAQIGREGAGLFSKFTGFVGYASQVAKSVREPEWVRKAAQALADAHLDSVGGAVLTGAAAGWGLGKAVGSAVNTAYGATSLFRRYQLRLFDGRLPDGRILELKGPVDSYTNNKYPGSIEKKVQEGVDQCKVNNEMPVVASCKSCQPAPCTYDDATGQSSCT